MGTESSAVAKIIEIAGRRRIRDTGDPLATDVTKQVKNPLPPEVTKPSRLPSVVIGVCVVAAVGFGVYLGSNYMKAGSSTSGVATPPAGPEIKPLAVAASNEAVADDAEGAAPAPAPALTPAAVAEVPPAATAEPAVAPLVVNYTPEQLANTGFDLRVDPPLAANVFLDGKPLGVAPLRVRNLLPGAHRIDLVPPTGYLASSVTVTLKTQEPRELRVKLRRDDDTTADDSAATESEQATDSDRRRDDKRAEKRQRDRDKKKERDAKKMTSDVLETSSARTGKLKIGAKPPCDIYLNGRRVGKTPKVLTLKEGTYRVSLVNSEFSIKKSMKTRVKAGATTRLIRDMTNKMK